MSSEISGSRACFDSGDRTIGFAWSIIDAGVVRARYVCNCMGRDNLI